MQTYSAYLMISHQCPSLYISFTIMIDLKAMNTAVNAAVQIEPFKFFHKINESICNYREALQYSNTQSSNVGGFQGRSNKPAGIAHLGKLCTVTCSRSLFQIFD